MDPLLIANCLVVTLLGAASLRWGDAPERACAATLFAMTFGDAAYHLFVGRGPVYGSVDIGHLLIDLGVAAAFICVALRANRVYPLWLAAFQLVSVVSHFAREVTDIFPPLAYGLMSYIPYYVVLLILAGGVWRHAIRKKHYGRYRSWRASSNPSPANMHQSPPNG